MYLVVIFELFWLDSSQTVWVSTQNLNLKKSILSFNSKLELDSNQNFELKTRFCLAVDKLAENNLTFGISITQIEGCYHFRCFWLCAVLLCLLLLLLLLLLFFFFLMLLLMLPLLDVVVMIDIVIVVYTVV